MIRLTFANSSDQRVVAFIRSRGPRIKENVRETLDTLMLELQRLVVSKLSGQVLAHHSGKLAGSITKEPTVVSGGQIVGKVTGAGGPAFYGKIQEKGGTRTYEILPVHKKALAFFPGGSLGAGGGIAPVQKSLIRGLYYKSGSRRGELKEETYNRFGQYGGVVVMKVVHPPLPPRPFMKTSQEEMRSTIIDRIKASAAAALKG